MQAFTVKLTMPPKLFDDKFSDGDKRAVMTVAPCTPDGEVLGDEMTVSKPDYTQSGKMIMSLSKGQVVWIHKAGTIPKGKNKGNPYYDILSFIGKGKRAYLDPCEALGRSADASGSASTHSAPNTSSQTGAAEGKDKAIYRSGLPDAYLAAYDAVMERRSDIPPEAAATLAASMMEYLERGGRQQETSSATGEANALPPHVANVPESDLY